MNAQNFNYKDLATAAAIFFLLICLTSYLYSMFDLVPGFFLPLTGALAAIFIYKLMDCRKGRTSLNDLQKVGKEFTFLAISSTIFGLIMPMIFPSGAYDYTRWLVWINTTFLAGGLIGIPFARCYLKLVELVAKKRIHSII